MKHPYRSAVFGIANVVLLITACAAAIEGDYQQATFRMLAALYIHVVYLQER